MIPLALIPLGPELFIERFGHALHWRAIVKAGLRYETGCSPWGARSTPGNSGITSRNIAVLRPSRETR